MRPSLAVFLCFMLAACPAAKLPQKPESQAAPEPATSATTEEQTKPGQGGARDFPGVWTTSDEQGQNFDLVIFANGQIATTWTKGKDGAQGRRGFWRTEGSRLIAMYDDGSSGVITTGENGLAYSSHAPQGPLSGPAVSSAALTPVKEELAPYVGIWRLNKEPDGNYQYIALQSSGRAISTVNGGTEGQWSVTDKGAECKWPDGWVDLIESSSSGWQKRSFVGTSTDAPADISPAIRMGDARYTVTAP